jgi:hypothetical protein
MRYLSGAEMARMRVTTEAFSYDPAARDAPRLETPIVEAPPADMPPAEIAAAGTPSLPHNAEEAALKLVADIVAAHGLNASTAISRVTDSYAASVEYHGRRSALADVLREKQSYFQRWPQREYRIRQDSLGVTCEAAVCEVMGIYDWSVRNSGQDQKFAGVARFTYAVDVANMRIVAERSEIVDR